MNVSPKVNASGVVALVTALVVTYVLGKVPSFAAHSDLVQAAVTAVLTAAAAWVAGYWTKATAWATRYVQSHETRTAPFVPGNSE